MENSPISPLDAAQEDERNRTWEENHQKIIAVISKNMEYHRRLPPTITEISKATGLTRRTIYQHLKEYSTHPAYKQRSEMFEAMQFEVLMEICGQAIGGNMKAAKLYLELTGKMQQHSPAQNFSGNNVQINGMVINQQILQSLNPEQLKIIEDILKPVLIK
ncbi:MAG TPA: hypothetical protein VK806_13475 [Bacteroidia bacterium]|nr:hypothetical protein [Bacteroidia bacterium]